MCGYQNYKDRVLKAKDIDSAVTGRTHGHPVRCLRNQMTREYVKLENEGKSFEELCLDAVGDDEIEISREDTLRMVRGELPGWRLVGVQFTASGGFSAFYANEHPTEALARSEDKYSYIFASGVSFFFVERDCLEVELEVDYADGLPPRHYVGKITHNRKDGIKTEIIEFLGKRKVRKMRFSENEYGSNCIPGHVCHITEY